MVLADDSAAPALVALDLMTEAEHGPDSTTVLVTTSTYTAEEDFTGADRIVPELGEPGSSVCVTLADMRALLQPADSTVFAAAAPAGFTWGDQLVY